VRVLALGGGTGTVLGQTMRALAVARRLHRAGEQVLFGYTGRANPAVEEAGVPLEVLPEPEAGRPAFAFRKTGVGASLDDDPERRASFEAWTRAVAAGEEALARRFRPDVVLAGTFTGPTAARAVGVPCVFVALQPRGAATLRMFGGVVAERFRRLIGRVEAFVLEGMPELAAADAEGGPPLGDGPSAEVHHVGPLLLRDPEELPAPGELRRRLGVEGPEPLVWITVGGGSDLLGLEFLRLAGEAFRLLPACRALLSTGFRVSERPADLPPNVRAERYFPGEEAVWASDAVVFHGGSSTLMHLVGCGRPGIALPSIDEQRDNAAALERFGAGLSLDPERLTAEVLAGAVSRVLTDPSFRAGAARLRRLAEPYGGALRAAEIVLAAGRRR
jgi:UDP:flavonoid glycosyltransferase YjiC (YdhE family)